MNDIVLQTHQLGKHFGNVVAVQAVNLQVNKVSNILSKLHLGDRTQAAVYAWRKGIVQRE